MKKKKKKIVVIGGGTGSFMVLSGLKKHDVDLTAIVAVTDDGGGSTGRLRDEFGFLPVGDMRQCIAALSNSQDDSSLNKLLLYRFAKGEPGLKGHSLGNLILTALEDISGSEVKGLELASQIFKLKGEVVPVSLKLVRLVAHYKSGKKIEGEHKIEINRLKKGDRIVHLETRPIARINSRAKKAILAADLIILGPGDLFDSTIANLVIKGVPQAVKKSKAKTVYIVNLMTLRSQTEGFKVSDHLKTLEQYLSRKADYVLVNKTPIPQKILKTYQEKESEFSVKDDLGKDKRVIRGDFLDKRKIKKAPGDTLKRSLIRHHPGKLAKKIITLLKR